MRHQRLEAQQVGTDAALSRSARFPILSSVPRFLADADWAVVRSETLVKNPYKDREDKGDEESEEEDFWNKGRTVCPDCFKEVIFDLTDKEYDELLK